MKAWKFGLVPCFSMGSDFTPQRQVEICGDLFSCHNCGGGGAGKRGSPGIQWVEVRGAVKHLTMHIATPTTKKHLVHTVNDAKTQKL